MAVRGGGWHKQGGKSSVVERKVVESYGVFYNVVILVKYIQDDNI
jgi:hypothetical protein